MMDKGESESAGEGMEGLSEVDLTLLRTRSGARCRAVVGLAATLGEIKHSMVRG